MLWSRLVVATLLGAVTLTLVGGIANAAGRIPDSSGVIHGCFKTQNGQLRVIDPATQMCRPSETAIFWNQTGAQGLAGSPGAALGFAHVLANGTVVAGESKNVSTTNVSRFQTGSYCFNGMGFTPKSVVVTQDATQNPDFVRAAANTQFGFTGCTNLVNQAAVIFNAPDAARTLVDSGFFIVFN